MSYRGQRVARYRRVELLSDATYSLLSRFTDTWEQGLHKRWTRCSTPSSYTMRSTQSCMVGSRVRHGRRPRIPHGIGDVRQRDSTSLVAIGWRGTSGHRKALPKTLASKGARKSTGDVAGQTNDQRLPSQIEKLQTTTDLLHPTLPSRRIVCTIAHGRNTDRRSTVPSRVLRNFSRHDQVTYCFPTHDYHTIYWRGELLRRLRRYNIFVSGLMVHKLTKYLQRNRPLWLPSIRLADLLRAFNSIPGTGVLHPQQVYESSGCARHSVLSIS